MTETAAASDVSTGSNGRGAGSASGGVSAVDRAVDVLLLFGRSVRPSLGVTEIAQELGLPKSGVHRVLTTLRARRLVTYDPATRKYALGQAAVALSQSYVTRLDIQSMATGTVNALMQSTGETSSLAVRRHGSVVHRAQAVPDTELRVQLHVGQAVPLHTEAAGKSFLAFLPDNESDDYFRRPTLEALTSATITHETELRADLAKVRERGWAVSTDERLLGVSSVAAPVFDHEGYPAAALAVSGPTARFDVDVAAPEVVAGAASLSRDMGHVLG